MKIGVYALAKNEAHNVPIWTASTAAADVRVVTDTGSTDQTRQLLEHAGVTVATGTPVPWRWDDAHQLSLNHLPADVDIAIRLDLDEELAPGWREALEAAWTPATTKLRYWYEWSHELRFLSDRVHARAGYRWTGATHEGLTRWDGPELETFAPGLTIRHHRQPGKKHTSDLKLLRRAVHEAPGDARMAWYLARELDYANDPEALEHWKRYLASPGGSPTERAYACRALAKLEPAHERRHLANAILESPAEPEAYLALASIAHKIGDPVSQLYYARHAAACTDSARTHASTPAAYGSAAPDLAAVAAYQLGLTTEAHRHAAVAAARDPDDPRLAQNLAILTLATQEKGPRAD